jgi:hypothetical protein
MRDVARVHRSYPVVLEGLTFRVGNHNPRNLYRVNPDGTETHVGCVFDETFGPIVVAALNSASSRATPSSAKFRQDLAEPAPAPVAGDLRERVCEALTSAGANGLWVEEDWADAVLSVVGPLLDAKDTEVHEVAVARDIAEYQRDEARAEVEVVRESLLGELASVCANRDEIAEQLRQALAEVERLRLQAGEITKRDGTCPRCGQHDARGADGTLCWPCEVSMADGIIADRGKEIARLQGELRERTRDVHALLDVEDPGNYLPSWNTLIERVAELVTPPASSSLVETRPTTTITTTDSLKMLRETFCVAQRFCGQTGRQEWQRHMDRLQRLIDDIDRQRPLGPDGKHGDGERCTPTCGCQDASSSPLETQPPDKETSEPSEWKPGDLVEYNAWGCRFTARLIARHDDSDKCWRSTVETFTGYHDPEGIYLIGSEVSVVEGHSRKIESAPDTGSCAGSTGCTSTTVHLSDCPKARCAPDEPVQAADRAAMPGPRPTPRPVADLAIDCDQEIWYRTNSGSFARAHDGFTLPAHKLAADFGVITWYCKVSAPADAEVAFKSEAGNLNLTTEGSTAVEASAGTSNAMGGIVGPRQPRVWRHNAPDNPARPELGERVTVQNDNGKTWNQNGRQWFAPNAGPNGGYWFWALVENFGPLTEVVEQAPTDSPDPAQEA